MLFLTNVNLNVIGLGVFTNDHTLVYRSCRADEERSSILCLIKTVGGCNTLLRCNERGCEASLDLTAEGLVACENRGNKTLTASIGKKLGAITEETSCRNGVEELLTSAVKLHIVKSSLTRAKLLHYRAHIFLGNVDNNLLDRLALNTVDFLIKHSGVRAAKLVALAAHIFDKNREMHFASARNAEGVGGLTVGYTERNVTKKLLIKSCTKVTGGNELALLACKGRIVNREGHLHCGLANLNELEGLNLSRRAYGITDRDILTAGEADNVTNLRLGYGNTLKSVKLIDRNDLGRTILAVAVVVTYHNALSLLDHTALNSTNADTTNELVVVDRGNENLKGLFLLSVGSRHIFKNCVKKGCKILAGSMRIKGSSTCSTRAEEHGRVKLLVGSIKLKKKLKHLVTDLIKTCIGTVNLVNNDDNAVVHRKCLLKHESGLGHRALCRVDEKDNTVNHLKDTLNLATEVCVSGGVNHVDLNTLIVNSSILCKNGNATLSFEIVRVHYSFLGLLILAIDTALTKHLVNQGGLAVVNVSNNSNIS